MGADERTMTWPVIKMGAAFLLYGAISTFVHRSKYLEGVFEQVVVKRSDELQKFVKKEMSDESVYWTYHTGFDVIKERFGKCRPLLEHESSYLDQLQHTSACADLCRLAKDLAEDREALGEALDEQFWFGGTFTDQYLSWRGELQGISKVNNSLETKTCIQMIEDVTRMSLGLNVLSAAFLILAAFTSLCTHACIAKQVFVFVLAMLSIEEAPQFGLFFFLLGAFFDRFKYILRRYATSVRPVLDSPLSTFGILVYCIVAIAYWHYSLVYRHSIVSQDDKLVIKVFSYLRAGAFGFIASMEQACTARKYTMEAACTARRHGDVLPAQALL